MVGHLSAAVLVAGRLVSRGSWSRRVCVFGCGFAELVSVVGELWVLWRGGVMGSGIEMWFSDCARIGSGITSAISVPTAGRSLRGHGQRI